MAVKHSTIHIPNDIVPSADWNANHTIENNTILTQHININADLPFNDHKATGVKDPTLNQDAATKKYVDDSIVPGLNPPIGSIMPWLKSYTNTPALPGGWVECNGQVLVDAESVYNGQTIPDLNGDNRFLRGNATSGGAGGSATQTASLANGPHAGSSNPDTWVGDSINSAGELHAYNTSGTTSYFQAKKSSTASFSILPPYYNVVWIMRVK